MPNDVAESLKFVSNLKDKLHAASEVEIDGRKYSRGDIFPVREPSIPKIELHTLTGVSDYLAANVDGLDLATCMVHVVAPDRVDVLTNAFGPFKQRTQVIQSTALLSVFQFGKFMSSEAFIIGVNALFVDGADKEELLRSVAAIKVEAGGTIQDNGVSQTVKVEAGVRLLAEKSIKPKVTLHPFCTFLEIEQPAREFILRLNSEGQPGLFVADGDAWRNKSMADISVWLRNAVPEEVKVIA